MGRQLDRRTLGIIGYGAIGRDLAPLGLALGMRVLVADPLAPRWRRRGWSMCRWRPLLAEATRRLPRHRQ